MKTFLLVIISAFLNISSISAEKFVNPVINADVPDPDVIRVGDDFYMVSTTMHLMPGAPIMKSKDLGRHTSMRLILRMALGDLCQDLSTFMTTRCSLMR